MWPRLASRCLSPSEIIESSRYIASKWRDLNAFVTECWAEAQKFSSELADKRDIDVSNPLHGMPLAVKDNFCVKGIKTSCGSQMLDRYIPPYTATVVQRLQDKGMVVVSKSNMDSFAMGSGSLDGFTGPTKNPWTWVHRLSKKSDDKRYNTGTIELLKKREPGRIPIMDPARDFTSDTDFFIAGGSSGGSAASVAAGIVYGALGSDTGGSVRIPSAYCGVVGLKPTYGLLSRHGLIALVNSLDCPGIMTQTVEQCAHMLNATAGHDEKDSTTYHSRKYEHITLDNEPSVKGLKIGIPKEYHSPYTTEDIIDTWDHVASELKKAGAEVREVSLPHTQYSIACYSILNCCEVASNMARYDGIEFGHRGDNETSTEALYAQTRHEALSDVVRGRIFAGNYFLLRKNYEKYYIKAAQVRRKIYNEFNAVFNDVDVLLTPTTVSDAPLYSQFMSQDNRAQCAIQDVYTQPSNLAGVPAISVPVRLSKNCLPLSIQLIAKQFDEKTLLRTARWVELNSDFPRLYNDISS